MSSNWVKWFHNGIPDQEGAKREEKGIYWKLIITANGVLHFPVVTSQ